MDVASHTPAPPASDDTKGDDGPDTDAAADEALARSPGLHSCPSDVLHSVLTVLNEGSLHRCVFLTKGLRLDLRPRGPVWRAMCLLTFRPPVYRRAMGGQIAGRFAHWADMSRKRPRVRTDGMYVIGEMTM